MDVTALFDLPATRTQHLARLEQLLDEVWDEAALLSEVDRVEALITPHVHVDDALYSDRVDRADRAGTRVRRAGTVVRRAGPSCPPDPTRSSSIGSGQPATGICSMWIQAYWIAHELVDSHTCVLKQIGASIQCTAGNSTEPDEAGCWPDKCAQYCAQQGQSGSCDGSVCRCH